MIAVMRMLLAMFTLIVMQACTSTPIAVTSTAHQPKILLVNSNRAIPRYNTAEQAFTEVLTEALENELLISINLENDERPTETLQDILNQHRFSAIYCIGAKALGSVDYIGPALPVVYSSVLNWRKFQNKPGYFGVTSEVAPAAQLAWFKHFFPSVKRIGILYSEDNQALITDAAKSANSLSLTLQSELINHKSDRNPQISRLLNQVDALWVLPDPLILDSEKHTVQLFELAHKVRKPIFTYNSFFMGFGATLSINADLATTGRQAALLIQTLHEQGAPTSGVQFPAGSSISLNLRKVSDNNLELNIEAFSSVNELLDE